MWMTLLYIVAVAVVVVIAAVAFLYAAVFVALGLGVLFGFKVAWVKRKFLMGLIPNEEVTPAGFTVSLVEASYDAVRNRVKSKAVDNSKELPTNEPKRITSKHDEQRGQRQKRRRPPQQSE